MDLILIGLICLTAANRLTSTMVDIELPDPLLILLVPTALCIGMLMAQGLLE